jgi:hypothetical protein
MEFILKVDGISFTSYSLKACEFGDFISFASLTKGPPIIEK